MPIPKDFNWETLTTKSSDELEVHYSKLLRELGNEKDILGQIFIKSQNKIQDTAKLYKLIALINAGQWVLMGVKDKGDIYCSLKTCLSFNIFNRSSALDSKMLFFKS